MVRVRMGKRRLVCAVAWLGVTVVVLMGLRSREPRYAGKPLSEWLADLDLAASAPSDQTAEALRAVRTIGTNGFPWLLHMMGTKESRWERIAVALESKLAFFHFEVTPASLTRARAIEGYVALGPVADAAVPGLIELMDPKRPPEVRAGAATALGQIGFGARQAIPVLQRAAQDANAEVSKTALFALANIQMSIRDLRL